MKFTDKQIKIIKLADKKGNDADLFLMTEIDKMEDKIDDINEKVNNLKDDLTGKIESKAEELKELIPEAIKGEKGERGEKGGKGERGERGFSGKDADEEKIEEKILKKIPKPKDGQDGKDGLNGADGSPDTPEMIKTKLELLQGDERLEISAIKNLSEELEELRKLKTQKLGGGGFSKIAMDMHFATGELTGTVDGVNTVFTLPYTPSPADSLEIYIDTMRLWLTDDWTLSGLTITFLLAPPAGSKARYSCRI